MVVDGRKLKFLTDSPTPESGRSSESSSSKPKFLRAGHSIFKGKCSCLLPSSLSVMS